MHDGHEGVLRLRLVLNTKDGLKVLVPVQVALRPGKAECKHGVAHNNAHASKRPDANQCIQRPFL